MCDSGHVNTAQRLMASLSNHTRSKNPTARILSAYYTQQACIELSPCQALGEFIFKVIYLFKGSFELASRRLYIIF